MRHDLLAGVLSMDLEGKIPFKYLMNTGGILYMEQKDAQSTYDLKQMYINRYTQHKYVTNNFLYICKAFFNMQYRNWRHQDHKILVKPCAKPKYLHGVRLVKKL